MAIRQQPDSDFIEVKCDECGNEQPVFNKPSQDVKCLVCDDVLVEATGGKGRVKGELLQQLT
ncbi:MAG: 30S ribosomal protein S27e [Candidatus Nanohaloarchaea archaeon]|nr:30S ribosomal protein S27e [Candidatus Nanohaloarchaea archaeon]